jgi:hypothetical protein
MSFIFNCLLFIASLVVLLMAGAFGAVSVKYDVKASRAVAQAFLIGSWMSLVLGLIGIALLCWGTGLSFWLLLLAPLPGFVGMFLGAPPAGRGV